MSPNWNTSKKWAESATNWRLSCHKHAQSISTYNDIPFISSMDFVISIAAYGYVVAIASVDDVVRTNILKDRKYFCYATNYSISEVSVAASYDI